MARFDIAGLNYVSPYPTDHRQALDYYGSVFGPLDVEDSDTGVYCPLTGD